jgi:hypothetical protein
MDPNRETPAQAEITESRIQDIDRAVRNFDTAIRQVADQLQAAALDALYNLTPENATRAQALVDLQRELQRQLNRLNYDGRLQSFIGEYDAIATSAIATLDAMGITDTGRLGPIDTKVLGALKRMDYRFLSEIGPAAVQAVSFGVVQNTLVGTPRSRIIANIRDTLDAKLTGYAVTYADTALSAYDRRVTMATWKQAGLRRFMYRGPKDVKNRPFCARHVGKVYTLEEIKRMDNGTKLMPVLVYGGGWSCRHIFTPVPQRLDPQPPAAAALDDSFGLDAFLGQIAASPARPQPRVKRGSGADCSSALARSRKVSSGTTCRCAGLLWRATRRESRTNTQPCGAGHRQSWTRCDRAAN